MRRSLGSVFFAGLACHYAAKGFLALHFSNGNRAAFFRIKKINLCTRDHIRPACRKQFKRLRQNAGARKRTGTEAV